MHMVRRRATEKMSEKEMVRRKSRAATIHFRVNVMMFTHCFGIHGGPHQ